MGINRLGLFFLFALLCDVALGGNGILPTGYGANSSMMGGADVAITLDTTTVVENPAGLAAFSAPAADFYLSPFYLENRHEDDLGNDEVSGSRRGALFGASFAKPLSRSDLVVGLGFFVQGGAGYLYKDLETGVGDPDELSNSASVFKLAPALSWQFDEYLSIGMNMGVSYASFEANILPNTSYFSHLGGQPPFFGMKLNAVSDVATNVGLGVQWKPAPNWYVGVSYSSESKLSLEGNSFEINMSAIGQGRVHFSKVRLKNMSLPATFSIGTGYERERWMIAAEYTRIDYSSAFDQLTLIASHSNSTRLESLEIPFDLDFSDQNVISLGIQYKLSDQTRIISGLNYAKHPIPENKMNPLIAFITERHISLGISRDFNANYSFDVGAEFQLPGSARYDNSELPAVKSAQESSVGLLIHLMLSTRW